MLSAGVEEAHKASGWNMDLHMVGTPKCELSLGEADSPGQPGLWGIRASEIKTAECCLVWLPLPTRLHLESPRRHSSGKWGISINCGGKTHPRVGVINWTSMLNKKKQKVWRSPWNAGVHCSLLPGPWRCERTAPHSCCHPWRLPLLPHLPHQDA